VAERDDAEHQAEDPALAVAARHALHDEELVAAFAVDGDDSDDPVRARSLIERCVACRDLHADLVGVHRALQASGNAEAVAATRRAPRDFRLSIETANRLRPGSVALRLRDRVALGFRAFSRPMGASMAALGVVGLLLGTFTLGGGTVLAPAIDEVTTLSSGPPAAVSTPSPRSGELTGGPAPSSGSDRSIAPFATEMIEVSNDSGGPGSATGAPTGPIAIIGGSIVLLVAGLGLLVLGTRGKGTGSARLASEPRDAAPEPS
jgi:hypothetical protein